jgi:putative membrane protein
VAFIIKMVVQPTMQAKPTPGVSSIPNDHTKALDAFALEAKDTQDAKFRAAVIEGKTKVAAHKNMAYDLEKKL